jgi:hypothetical protein
MTKNSSFTVEKIMKGFQTTGEASALIWLCCIRIRIENSDPGPGARELIQNSQINMISSVSRRLLYIHIGTGMF